MIQSQRTSTTKLRRRRNKEEEDGTRTNLSMIKAKLSQTPTTMSQTQKPQEWERKPDMDDDNNAACSFLIEFLNRRTIWFFIPSQTNDNYISFYGCIHHRSDKRKNSFRVYYSEIAATEVFSFENVFNFPCILFANILETI